MQTLTSARNPALKEIRKAIVRGSITDQGYCVAEGFHLLEEALRSGCEVHAVFALEPVAGQIPAGLRVNIISRELLQTIASTEASQGVVALVRPPQWTIEAVFASSGPVVVLDGIQDPGNAGAIIRAAEAFEASGVAMLKGSVDPFNPKALRGSAGSIFRVPVVAGLGPEAILDYGRPLFALMPSAGVSLGDCRFNERCVLVIGNEGRGVSEAVRSRATGIRICTHGVESLNAAMAATVVLYEAQRQGNERGSILPTLRP